MVKLATRDLEKCFLDAAKEIEKKGTGDKHDIARAMLFAAVSLTADGEMLKHYHFLKDTREYADYCIGHIERIANEQHEAGQSR